MKCIDCTQWIEGLQSVVRGIVTPLMLVLATAVGTVETSRAQSVENAYPDHQVFTEVQKIRGNSFEFLNTCSGDAPCPGTADQTVDTRGMFSATVGPVDSVSETSDASRDNVKPTGVAANRTFNHDSNLGIYYRNRLEFSLDGGWLPVNIPFVFDVFLGDGYTMTSLRYTLVPIIASVRWQMNDVGGPWIFRGNWDLTASGAVTLIPRGPETHYYAWIMGVRRNFVPRRGKFAPYFDGRLGLGEINAKEPFGVLYAQGQNFTFTVNMGSGLRYNFNPRYSVSAGLNWMHISNLYLSEPKFANYGINVYGPMFGINVRWGRLHHHGSE